MLPNNVQENKGAKDEKAHQKTENLIYFGYYFHMALLKV